MSNMSYIYLDFDLHEGGTTPHENSYISNFDEIWTIGIRHQLSKTPKISTNSEDFKALLMGKGGGGLKPQILGIFQVPKPFNGFSLRLV